MATIVTYNGITMHSVLTQRFEQMPQYDPTGTDVLFSRFTMAFEGIVHAQGMNASVPTWTANSKGDENQSSGDISNAISLALWQPRQVLSVVMGGVEILHCDGAQTTDTPAPNADVDNGPKPKNVRLSHITSSNTVGPTFHVTFEIECARNRCGGEDGPQPVLNNRWSISEGFDEAYFTTRTIRGELRFSSSLVGFRADSYRSLIVPTLENGFKRVRLDYNLHADGLVVDYQVVDQQVHTAAPWPAAKLSVRHSEGTADGGKFESEVHVSLEGHPGASKITLFAMAARIVEDRLGKISNFVNKNQVPVAFTLVDIIGERNGIELYMKIQHASNPFNKDIGYQQKDLLGMPIGSMGVPLGSFSKIRGPGKTYKPTKSQVPNPLGYDSQGGDFISGGKDRVSGIIRLLMKCYLQVPCDDKHYISQHRDQSTTGTKTPPSPTEDVIVRTDPALEPLPKDWHTPTYDSPANQAGLYTVCAAETTLSKNPMRVQMPYAIYSTENKKKDTCVFVQLGLEQAQLTFHVEAERAGHWPAVPEPLDTWTDAETQITGYLLNATIKPMPPTTDATKTQAIFHVSARIVYGLSRPYLRDEKIPIGVLPFTNFTPDSTRLKLKNLYKSAVQPVGSYSQADDIDD